MLSKNSQSDHIRYLKKACLMCDRSSCKVKTGAVAVRSGKVIASGYNELLTAQSTNNSPERDNAIHAEAFLISKAASKGVSVKGATLYLTRFPCLSCARLIYKSGIKRVFYMSDLFTSGNVAEPLLDVLGIKIIQIKEEDVWKV